MKLNVENEHIEPVTDLGLALGNSSHCNQQILKNDSGAGANAGSRVDVTFVATDPLSELVWSPQKGLSLKCADCSFTEKKPSHFWGAGTSNLVVSSSQNRGSSTDNPKVEENNMTLSQVAFHVKCEDTSKDAFGVSPKSDTEVMPVCQVSLESEPGKEEMNTMVGADTSQYNQKEDQRGDNKEDESKPNMVQNDPSSREPIGEGRDVGNDDQILEMEIVLSSNAPPTNECGAYYASVHNQMFSGRELEESASFVEREKNKKMEKTVYSSVSPVGKLESSAENDLQTLIGDNACAAAGTIVASESESTHEVKNNSQQDEDIRPRGKTVPPEHSPTNSQIQMYRRKGKAKAFCDGDANERMLEEDDSHESVESCNTAGSFSRGNKRWDFEQQLIVGNKRVKRQIQESPESTSLVKQDSSFMNWISNMMKGFLKSNKDEPPSHTLAVTDPNYRHEIHDEKVPKCQKNQDPRGRTAGFQSIFQSLYCPKLKAQETNTFNSSQQTPEESSGLQLSNKVCDFTATPISCRGLNGYICNPFLLSNERFNETTSRNEAISAAQSKKLSVNLVSSQEKSKTDSAENKNSLAAGKERDGTSLNSPLGQRKTNSAENVDSEPPSQVKTHNLGIRSDPLESLWITRYTLKPSVPLLNQDHCKHARGALEFTDGTGFVSHYQNHVGFPSGQKIVEAREQSTKEAIIATGQELQNCAVGNDDASISFNQMKDHCDLKSIHKFSPILPSLRFKNSEAMASVFARRLDALRHSVPLDVTDNAARVTMTCFFCGIKGHHLRNCSETTGDELEDLLGKINSCDGPEELSPLCIRCFQSNHWAVACPNALSRGQNQLACGASLVNDCSLSTMKLNARNKENPTLSDGEKIQFQTPRAHIACNGNDVRTKKNLDLNLKFNEVAPCDNMRTIAKSFKECVASMSRENMLKENQMASLSNLNWQISEVPERIFEAVKMLRLSRTDILKWMNSHMPLQHLDGFFLRLRVGKREGLGGTRYFVARITGLQRHSSDQDSKTSVSVNIGGIKCLVESQYISNQDFLDDELMAWWSVTLRGGGNIPSEEDLRLKVKEKKMLGF